MKFDFRRQLKGKTLEQLKALRNYHLGIMLNLTNCGHKDAQKELRYIGYIESEINKLKKK